MTDPDTQRAAIRDAMARLLDGAPIRSDGKLTIKTSPTRPASNAGCSPTDTPTCKQSSETASPPTAKTPNQSSA